MVFMVLSATSFALHFVSFKTLNILNYWRDAEFRGYVYFIGSMGIIVSFVLIGTGYYTHHNEAWWHGFFQVVSFGTNTGFTSTEDYSSWPLFIPILLAIIGLIGGCAGSTSGGLKVIRAVLVRKQAVREIYKLIHPNGVFPIKLGNKVMSESVVNSVWGFIAGYFLVFIVAWLLLMATGVGQITAFSAVAACISNVGPGIGGVSVNYANLPDSAQIMLGATMLIGRLEVFTVLVLFVPDFWRR
jgi:trk system potassium uptake protein TrkH